MRLGFFPEGSRYRSRDLDPTAWLATYDVASLACFDDPRYITLRENRSSREQKLIDHGLGQLDRRIYKNLSSRGESGGPAPVIMAVISVVKEDLVDELHAWYEEVEVRPLLEIAPSYLVAGAFGRHIEDSRMASKSKIRID